MLAEVKMCGRQVKLYQMQGLLHYLAMLSDTQSYLSIASDISTASDVTRHFRQASPKKAEQLMIIVVVGGRLIISLFLGRLVFDSSERFLMKRTHIITD